MRTEVHFVGTNSFEQSCVFRIVNVKLERSFTYHPMQANQGHSWILDSTHCGFRIPGTEFQYLSVELGFWTPVVSGISDSLSSIPDSTTQDAGWHKQNLPGFPILQATDTLSWGDT